MPFARCVITNILHFLQMAMESYNFERCSIITVCGFYTLTLKPVRGKQNEEASKVFVIKAVLSTQR